MPRVETRTTRKSKSRRVCTGCHEEIGVGEKVYTWKRRFGRTGMRYWKHVACGRPRPTELSSAKTAQIEEEAESARAALAGWAPDFATEALAEGYAELDYDELTEILAPVADVAEEVAEEYEASADNMPESLQQGAQAEAMREVASELQEWADVLRDFTPDTTSVDFPEREEGQSKADWEQACEEAWDEAVAEATVNAEDALSDIPMYQG